MWAMHTPCKLCVLTSSGELTGFKFARLGLFSLPEGVTTFSFSEGRVAAGGPASGTGACGVLIQSSGSVKLAESGVGLLSTLFSGDRVAADGPSSRSGVSGILIWLSGSVTLIESGPGPQSII